MESDSKLVEVLVNWGAFFLLIGVWFALFRSGALKRWLPTNNDDLMREIQRQNALLIDLLEKNERRLQVLEDEQRRYRSD